MSQTLEEQRHRLQSVLAALHGAVSNLPADCPEGAADGPLERYFNDYEIHEEGLYFTVNCAWDRTFQVSDDEKVKLVTHGPYGLQLVYAFASYFAQQPGMEANNGLFLLAERVQNVIDLVDKVVQGSSIPPTVLVDSDVQLVTSGTEKVNNDAAPKAAKPKAVSIRGRKRAADPKAKGAKGKEPAMKKQKNNRGKAKSKKADSGSSGSSANEDDTDIEELEVRAGRTAEKGEWAFGQYERPTAATRNGSYVWRWKCKWCPAYRSSPRTKGCHDHSSDPYGYPRSSNFISHLEKQCPGLPESHTWDAWKSSAGSDSTNAVTTASAPGGGLSAQHAIMKEFTDRGAANPEKPNAQYAFAGTTGFWINAEWELKDVVLEFIPLDGDHSGKTSGRLIFKALKKYGVTKKLITNTADNTASNNLMNRAIAKRLLKAHKIDASAEQIQIGCAAHVLNLVVQAILHKVEAAPDPETEDLYNMMKEFPLVYNVQTDPNVIQETDRMAAETANAAGTAGAASDAGVLIESDDNSSSDDEPVYEDEDVVTRRQSGSKEKNPIEKLHAIVVDILRSEPRRRRMRQYIRQLCDKDYNHLVPVKSMPVRWNTTYAEIDRTLKLKPAINQWVEQLDTGTSGKAKQAAQRKKKQLHLELKDWEMLKSLRDTLKIFHEATLDLSKANEPTICKTLPLYKLIEDCLHAEHKKVARTADKYNLKHALDAGLKKLSLYMSKALISDYILLGAVLHPCIRLRYFKNSEKWSPEIAQRARTQLRKLYDECASTHCSSIATVESMQAMSSAPSSIFSQAIFLSDDSSMNNANVDELNTYFGGSYVCRDESRALEWWKDHSKHFPVLSRIARDILAIPGVSVLVERLFSSSKHTLSDTRSSLMAETASMAVVSKELLKKGLGENVNYLDGVAIHE
ncbi:hypothetical protein EWM64_g8111 [Hericium alpestre]|uniref:HAT C-terminal dimerisation domain-containing protein n=1 Tax=Hericium alpestre TaxID=135208 RepID=A0A4Y9ZM96_9AGAM|nr:hypothetical protein EWM64_g8111 [Hericium alpestre]